MAAYSPFITPGDVLGDFGANGWAPARPGYYLFLSYCPAHHGAIAGVLGELEGVIRVQVKDGIGYIALTSQASALSTVEVLRMMRCALISQEEWCARQWEQPGDNEHLGLLIKAAKERIMHLEGESGIPEDKLKSLLDSEMFNLNRMEAKLERDSSPIAARLAVVLGELARKGWPSSTSKNLHAVADGLQKLHVPLVDRARNYDIIYAEGRMLGGLKEGGEAPEMAQFHEQPLGTGGVKKSISPWICPRDTA